MVSGHLYFQAITYHPSIATAGIFELASPIPRAIVLSHTDGDRGPALGTGVTFSHFDHIIVSTLGNGVFWGGLAGPGIGRENNGAIYRLRDQGIELLARKGSEDRYGPNLGLGVKFSVLQPATSINDGGDVIFRGNFNGPINGSGVFKHDGSATRAIALTGRSDELGPGLGNGVEFSLLEGGALNLNGDALFGGLITGLPPASGLPQGLWLNSNGINLPVALAWVDDRFGPQLGSGIKFNSVGSLPVLDDSRAVVFSAQLTGPGITIENNQGLWVWNDGNISLLIRKGDQFDVDPGPEVDYRRIIGFAYGDPLDRHRHERALQNGIFVFEMQFDDGSEGIYTVQVPEPEAIYTALMALTVLLGLRFTRRRAYKQADRTVGWVLH